jgi:hypothetical protein
MTSIQLYFSHDQFRQHDRMNAGFPTNNQTARTEKSNMSNKSNMIKFSLKSLLSMLRWGGGVRYRTFKEQKCTQEFAVLQNIDNSKNAGKIIHNVCVQNSGSENHTCACNQQSQFSDLSRKGQSKDISNSFAFTLTFAFTFTIAFTFLVTFLISVLFSLRYFAFIGGVGFVVVSISSLFYYLLSSLGTCYRFLGIVCFYRAVMSLVYFIFIPNFSNRKARKARKARGGRDTLIESDYSILVYFVTSCKILVTETINCFRFLLWFLLRFLFFELSCRPNNFR